MAAPIRIRLTPEEDARLLELTEDPQVHPKTRRWAQMVRLAGQGWTAPQIAAFFHRDCTAVLDTLKRFLLEGIPGLAYRKPPGAKAKVTPEVEGFLRGCLAEERTWTIPQLQEAVEAAFGVRLGRNTRHRHLRAMGYVWRRTRYVPAGRPTAEERENFLREEEEAKGGRGGRR